VNFNLQQKKAESIETVRRCWTQFKIFQSENVFQEWGQIKIMLRQNWDLVNRFSLKDILTNALQQRKRNLKWIVWESWF
jgi:hypothetical protein